jgi:hypothetical protein
MINKILSDIKNENILANKHSKLIYIFGLLTVIYYYFIAPKTIGNDNRYMIFIIIVPTLVGMLTLGLYRNQFLKNRISINKGFAIRTFVVSFYLIQGLIFSYITFGLIAKIGWDYYNYIETRKNHEETLTCPIIKIWTGKRPSIYFSFNNSTENIKVQYSKIKMYEGIDVNKLCLKIKATKGVWNYYSLNNWKIQDQTNCH